MENITHSLVGLAAAKAGLERLSPGATALCVLAANAPDADILALLGGKWAYLHHHRSITHSIVGTLALALLIPFMFSATDMIVARVRGRPKRLKFRGLLIASLIVSATHPLMDWTNNYGVRPWLPWDGRWSYGDLVFIVDPYLWLGIGGAAFLLTSTTKWRIGAWVALALCLTAAVLSPLLQNAGPLNPTPLRVLWLTGLACLAVARVLRIADHWGRSIAIVALALVFVYWGGLAVAHRRALAQAQVIAERLAAERGETLGRVVAMPTLANPLSWRCVSETERATYRFELSLGSVNGSGTVQDEVRYEKPQGREAEAVALASKDDRAQIFLNFARFPVAQVAGDCLSQALVQFADLRYTEPGAQRRGTFSIDIAVACPPKVGETNIK